MKYKHGQPFSEILSVNIKDGLDRVKLKKATCIIIDGGVGEGKTTLAVEIADYINELNGFKEVDLTEQGNKQVAMGGKDFSTKMRLCFQNKLPVIVYDEAGDYARKQAMTGFNAYLNRIFETYRAFKIVVIICLPNQYILDNTLFDNKIPRMLLHLYGRTANQGNFKGYSLTKMFYIRGLMRKIENKNYAYSEKVNACNFYGHFLDLSPERSKLLDKLTIKGKIDVLKSKEKDMGNLMSKQEIAEQLNMKVGSITNKFASFNIKPAQKIGNKVYYTKEQVSVITHGG